MKLDDEFQKAMADAEDREDGEFEPLPEGFYRVKPKSIKLSKMAGPSGYKQWVFVWEVVNPRKLAKRTVWERISLSPNAAFKMREVYDAMGFTYDSDSSELIGETCIVEIVHGTIESGRREGEISEDVAKHYSEEESGELVAK